MEQTLIDTLPTIEELQERGLPMPGRALTPAEQTLARQDRKARPKHLETKKKSEALCKRQLLKWGASLQKARDDEISVRDTSVSGGYRTIRVSKDVDFVGSIPLRINGNVTAYPFKVESKGITLKKKLRRIGEDDSREYVLRGSFPLSSLSAKERGYLTENRIRGGLSMVHLAWWLEGKIEAVHLVSWLPWASIEEALAKKAETDGRFGGKSLRYHADLELLELHGIIKVGGRWELYPDHPLSQYLPDKDEQPLLL